MSDLIIRSELINALKVHFDSCFRENGELLYSDHICTSDDVVDLIKLVENQPTVYDIGNVVEEFERKMKEVRNTEYSTDTFVNESIRTIVNNTISDLEEIVKQGGISDDVYEYENTDDEYCKWKINSVFPETINNPHIAERENIATTKYCPCCGKKIKVVEQ